MRLKIGNKAVSYEVETDAEKSAKLIEKGMDMHDKNWKEKFNIKHNAKKDILELKHKHDLENKEQDLKKKSFVKELIDGINENKRIKTENKLKLEEEAIRLEEERKRREEEEKKRARRERKILGIVILVVGLIITIVGYGFGSEGSGLQLVGGVGFIGCIAGFILLVRNNPK